MLAVIARGVVAVPETASVTLAVKLAVVAVGTAGAVGVPEMAPVAVLRLKPAGRAPVASAQVYGVVPPLAARVWL